MANHRRKLRAKTAAGLKIGEPARVRSGVLDRENPELPLGRWSGTIADLDEVEDEPDTLPEAADVNLTGGWLQIIAYFTSFGAILGPALATLTWGKSAACIGGVLLGLVMVIGQTTAEKERRFRFKRFADIAVALTAGLIFGAIYGVMAVAFVGTLSGVIVWLVLRRLYRGIKRPVFLDLPGSGMIAAACGVVAEAFYLNPKAAASGLCLGMPIGLGCGALICLAILAVVNLVYEPAPEPHYWRVR